MFYNTDSYPSLVLGLIKTNLIHVPTFSDKSGILKIPDHEKIFPESVKKKICTSGPITLLVDKTSCH